jgi:hypothetical protein
MWKTIVTVLPGICLFLAIPALAGDKTKAKEEQEYVKPITVEAKGKLWFPKAMIPEGVPDGVSGIYVEVKGKTYWLAFGNDKQGQELVKLAVKLKDKSVIVTGKLEMREILLQPRYAEVIVVTSLKAAAGDVKNYLTADGKLKETLTLTIGNNRGIVGGSFGTTWVIEPSGAWTMTTTPKDATAKGKLTAGQLAALAQHLATQDFNQLPARLGVKPYPDNNLPFVAISFGKKGSTLFGSLTERVPEAGDSNADDWSRFVAVTLVLQNILQETKAELK